MADTEIIISDGDYHAVATFMEKDEVRDYLEGCIFKSVLLAYQRKSDSVILRGLLQHVDQRMRFNHILGNGPFDEDEDDDYEEESDDESKLDKDEVLPENPLKFDLEKTNELLDRAVTRIKKIANKQGELLKTELNATEEPDQRVVDELFEGEFDQLLRQDEECPSIADELMDEIAIRFEGLAQGTIRKTKQGWPIFWEFSSLELASRRVWVERSEEWQQAYNQSGRGSTFVRAEIIEGSIYRKAAPVPDLTPSPDRNRFLREVLGLVETICKELNIKLE